MTVIIYAKCSHKHDKTTHVNCKKTLINDLQYALFCHVCNCSLCIIFQFKLKLWPKTESAYTKFNGPLLATCNTKMTTAKHWKLQCWYVTHKNFSRRIIQVVLHISLRLRYKIHGQFFLRVTQRLLQVKIIIYGVMALTSKLNHILTHFPE